METSRWAEILQIAGPWLIPALAVIIAIVFYRVRGYRLVNAPRRPRVISPELGLMLMCLMILMGLVGSVAVARLFGIVEVVQETETLAKLQLGAYLGQGLIVAVFAALVLKARRPDLDARWSPHGAVLFGLGTLLMAWPLVQTTGAAAGWIMEVVFKREPSTLAHDLLAVFVESEKDVWFWVLVGCATLLPGIFEEVLYRGLIQETLRRLRLGRWMAITITSAIFALMHLGNAEPHAVASLFILSLAFGWAYEKSGRLTAPIVMHILFNAGNLGMALWLTA